MRFGKRLLTGLILGVMCLLALQRCSDGKLASRYVKSQVVGAQGGSVEVSAAESTSLSGLRLVVPPGALTRDETLTVELGLDDLVSPVDRAGPVAVLGPSGLKFLLPVRLTLPVQLAAQQPASKLTVLVLEDDGSSSLVAHDRLELDAQNTRVNFAINGFTRFQPNTDPRNSECVGEDGGYVCPPVHCFVILADGGTPCAGRDGGVDQDGGTEPDGGEINCGPFFGDGGTACPEPELDAGTDPDGGEINCGPFFGDGGTVCPGPDAGPGADGGTINCDPFFGDGGSPCPGVDAGATDAGAGCHLILVDGGMVCAGADGGSVTVDAGALVVYDGCTSSGGVIQVRKSTGTTCAYVTLAQIPASAALPTIDISPAGSGWFVSEAGAGDIVGGCPPKGYAPSTSVAFAGAGDAGMVWGLASTTPELTFIDADFYFSSRPTEHFETGVWVNSVCP